VVVELFRLYRRSIGEGELGDDTLQIYEGEGNNTDDSDADDYIPKKRYSYPQERKLAAIEYYQKT
jgi:hypothetical protein